MNEDKLEIVTKALRRAFNLGQTYWQQADSESYSQNRKSDETRCKFDSLIDETALSLSTPSTNDVPRGANLAILLPLTVREHHGPNGRREVCMTYAEVLEFAQNIARLPQGELK